MVMSGVLAQATQAIPSTTTHNLIATLPLPAPAALLLSPHCLPEVRGPVSVRVPVVVVVPADPAPPGPGVKPHDYCSPRPGAHDPVSVSHDCHVECRQQHPDHQPR